MTPDRVSGSTFTSAPFDPPEGTHARLFPPQFGNFRGRKLRAATFAFSPFVFREKSKNG